MRDAQLGERIAEIHDECHGTYGWPRIHAELRHGGVRASRKRVARLMRRAGLSGMFIRRKGRTTIRVPGVATAPDLSARSVSRPSGVSPGASAIDLEGDPMGAAEAVRRYYDAWQNKGGDFSEVPLAEDFEFTGPVASFDSADGYRAMAREAGRAVTSFVVRRQFVDGDSVCSIIDWEMAIPGVGKLSAAEVLEVADGQIVRGELFYDGEALRRAMAA